MAYVCVCAACDVVHLVHVVCSVLCVCGMCMCVGVCGVCGVWFVYTHTQMCRPAWWQHQMFSKFQSKCIWSVKSDNLGSNPASTTFSYLTLGTLQNVPVPQFSHL